MGQRRKQQVRWVAVSLIWFSVMGCWQAPAVNPAASPANQTSQSRPSPQQVAVQAPKAVNPNVVAANTRFGFNLFAQLRQRDRKQNIFISPSSVAMALAMTYNGASGDTQQAMATALQVQKISLDDLNRANADLKAQLENPDPDVKLTIANALWAKRGVPFQPEFIERTRSFYNANVTDLDFNDPSATATINGWVKQTTQGKITQIVDGLKPDAVLFLINAIYFKGKWATPFEPRSTSRQPFYLLDGRSKPHPMMSQTGDYKYFENDRLQAVSLPYGKKRVSLIILLPKKSVNLDDFYTSLTPENWQQWMSQLSTRSGSIQLPRFKLDYSIELKESLSALGMGPAFDAAEANFAALSSIPTKIDQVKHKTVVEVNEEGTEAAAATSVGIVATSARMDEPFKLVVDRPFFCAIRDNQTGSVIFMGSIVDPK